MMHVLELPVLDGGAELPLLSRDLRPDLIRSPRRRYLLGRLAVLRRLGRGSCLLSGCTLPTCLGRGLRLCLLLPATREKRGRHEGHCEREPKRLGLHGSSLDKGSNGYCCGSSGLLFFGFTRQVLLGRPAAESVE